LRTGEFDALWIHGWARFTNWLAMFTAFASGIPVLLRGETNLLPSLPGWKRVLKRIILQRLFRRVSAFLAIGRYNKEFYEAYAVPKDRIFLAPYAVDNEFFLTRSKELVPKKSELKRALSIPDNLTVILFVGKLTQAKRPMDLLMAYETLSKHTEATLLYVGDGPLRSALESYVKIAGLKNVYFVGFKNQTELPSFYALADIFVLPSSLEPWGLVVNEVMIAGKPIIVSDHVGCGPDLVQDSVNGFIVPVGDIAALAERLRLLVSNPYLATQMGEASRERIARWGFRQDVAGLLEALECVVGQRSVS
jgi:glycosyltransferase involved in cell wall biosynthesis